MLQCYAGNEYATVKETQDLERLNRVDFHIFIMSKKQVAEERAAKHE